MTEQDEKALLFGFRYGTPGAPVVKAENPAPTVTIFDTEYQRLKSAETMLTCLQNAGVDNWDGYAGAMLEFETLELTESELAAMAQMREGGWALP